MSQIVERQINLMKKKFRSQKTCQIKNDSGIYLSLSGLSLQGLSPGPILGYSVDPRTEQNIILLIQMQSESP